MVKSKKKDGSGYELLIKRAIVIGQKDKTIIIEIINERIWVGESEQTMAPLQEDYLEDIKTPIGSSGITRWELSEGEIFFLGDNRNDSVDSRSKYGTCTMQQVVGVVPDWALPMRWLSGFLYDVGQFFSNLFRG